MTPGRIATVLAIVAGVAGAVAPAAANLDWTSTAGVIAGTLAIVGAIGKWLTGWQQHEARQATDPALVADLDDTAGAEDHPETPAPA
jgi:protein-S-isoprenylcysteine O-methyltransferase Ste14